MFSILKRWLTRSKSTSNRPADGTESMFIVPAVAPAAIQPSDTEGDDTEAVEGKSVDSNNANSDFGAESRCAASCGAMFP